ncbi:hypothetical protein GGI07_002339 [Coemansia sp. Benny D115]|nr:hypothetical protein GGI07_002339 [Coemansia sp. Benny D115]
MADEATTPLGATINNTSMAGGGFGSMLITSSLVIVLISAIGWFVLNKKSAEISKKSLAMAAGTSVSALQSKKRNMVVITGPMGGGKTALWCYLRFPDHNAAPRTQTSMSVNSAEIKLEDTSIYLVDIPGHQKYRFDRDTHLDSARSVIFVVDSTTISKDIRATAEQLYEVLANTHVQEKEVPVLIVCNKQDDASAISNTKIKALLETEMDNLRNSRQAGLESLKDTAAHNDDDAAVERASDFLGYEGKKFSFEDLPNAVQVNEASMAMGMSVGGMEQITAWIVDSLNA